MKLHFFNYPRAASNVHHALPGTRPLSRHHRGKDINYNEMNAALVVPRLRGEHFTHPNTAPIWIPSQENLLADLLSRRDFKKLATSASWYGDINLPRIAAHYLWRGHCSNTQRTHGTLGVQGAFHDAREAVSVRERLPIAHNILFRLLATLDQRSHHEAALYAAFCLAFAAFCLAFAAFLRIGEHGKPTSGPGPLRTSLAGASQAGPSLSGLKEATTWTDHSPCGSR